MDDDYEIKGKNNIVITSEQKLKLKAIKYKGDSYHMSNVKDTKNLMNKLHRLEEMNGKEKINTKKNFKLVSSVTAIPIKDKPIIKEESLPLIRKYICFCLKAKKRVFSNTKTKINIQNETQVTWMLYPDHTFRHIWDFLVFFLLMYTAVILPYTVCFIETNPTKGIGLVETIIDFFFLLDVILNFFFAYLNEFGIIIDDRRQIIVNYLCGYFTVDFLGCIPIQLLLSISSTHNKLELARIYKILRLFRLIKMVRVKKYDRILSHFVSYFNLNLSLSKIIFMILITFLLVHISSCIWYFLNKVEDFETSWIFTNNLQDKDDFEIYLVAFYWSSYTLFTIGFGDIKPSSNLEKIWCIIWIVYGALFYSYTFGNLKTIIESYDKKQLVINSKLKKIEDFSEKLKVSMELTGRIKSFYEHKFTNNLIYDNDNIIPELSETLINKIIKSVFKELIRNYDIFKDAPTKFVNDFILNLKPLYLREKGMVLYEYGKFTEEVYYNLKGKISFFSEEHKEVLLYSCFTYFGEVEVFFDEPRYFHAVTTEPCEMLFISKENYLTILMRFPKIFELEIYKAYKRREFYLKQTLKSRGILNPIKV